MQAGEFFNILNTKINTMQVDVFCLKTYVSLRPLNANCSFMEKSQNESKYDYDIIRNSNEFSLLEFLDPLRHITYCKGGFKGAQGSRCTCPRY
jgi:hypothetical protein